MTDVTRPDDDAADHPTLVIPTATGLPATGTPQPGAFDPAAAAPAPPSGPVPLVGTAPQRADRRWGPWLVVGAVVGGFLLVGGAFAAGFGTGYLVGDHRTTDDEGRFDELDSRMNERMDERLGDRLERLDRDRDGGAGQGRGDGGASSGALDDTLVNPQG